MIGSAYTSAAVQAVIGPGHSTEIPAVLWGGFLDGLGDLIAMTGLNVSHDAFTPITDGVANSASIDAGVAGTGWTIAAFALFDAATGGEVVASADISPYAPTDGEELTFAPGDLTFTIEVA